MTELLPLAIKLLDAKLLVRSWGNLSSRLDAEHFKITPSGRSYRKLKESDMVVVDLAGNYRGKVLPSSEKGLHAMIYRAFPAARVIIHTHQNFASAFSLSGQDLLLGADASGEEVAELLAANNSNLLPVTSYEPAGTEALDRAALSALERSASHSLLLAGHGAVFWGQSAEFCLGLALRTEDYCRAAYRSRGLAFPARALSGQAGFLEREEVESAANKANLPSAKNMALLFEDEPFFVQAFHKGLAAYLEDFAQMFGPELGPGQAGDGVWAHEQGLIFLGSDQEEAMNRHDIFLKNFLAAQVAEECQVPPLSEERARSLRQNYLNSYSKRY